MIKKFRSYDGLFYFIVFDIKHAYQIKNGLPIKYSNGMKLYYWTLNETGLTNYHRTDDLPVVLDFHDSYIQYSVYDFIYRYNGYATMEYTEKHYKFIKGICLQSLKDDLEYDY